jgi:excisionase family DNA binding protein
MDIPLAYSVHEACSVARAGRTTLYEAIKLGELRAVKRGRRTLILRQDLYLWISGLPAVPVKFQHHKPHSVATEPVTHLSKHKKR